MVMPWASTRRERVARTRRRWRARRICVTAPTVDGEGNSSGAPFQFDRVRRSARTTNISTVRTSRAPPSKTPATNRTFRHCERTRPGGCGRERLRYLAWFPDTRSSYCLPRVNDRIDGIGCFDAGERIGPCVISAAGPVTTWSRWRGRGRSRATRSYDGIGPRVQRLLLRRSTIAPAVSPVVVEHDLCDVSEDHRVLGLVHGVVRPRPTMEQDHRRSFPHRGTVRYGTSAGNIDEGPDTRLNLHPHGGTVHRAQMRLAERASCIDVGGSPWCELDRRTSASRPLCRTAYRMGHRPATCSCLRHFRRGRGGDRHRGHPRRGLPRRACLRRQPVAARSRSRARRLRGPARQWGGGGGPGASPGCQRSLRVRVVRGGAWWSSIRGCSSTTPY